MCEDCVKEEYPDRGNLCLESGCYLLNFVNCHECQDKSKPKTLNKTEEETNDEEMITFQHVCSKCNHIIAQHEHIFKVAGEYQGNLCLESGCYLLNFVNCHECQDKSKPKTLNKTEEETNDEEMITFQHVCSKCNHIIAQHEHIFKVAGEYQYYEMSCLLCGTGDDQRSVMPYDPRGPQMTNDFID